MEKKLFLNKFKATGDKSDVRYVNYNILGLHKKEYFDSKGDLTKVEFYASYDDETDIHSDLAILEERTYTRDASTALLTKRETTISWYDVDGAIQEQKTNVAKYYSAKKGFTANKRARQNLLDKASMYLFSALITNALGNFSTAEAQTEDFDILTDDSQSQYVKSTMQPLIDIITNSVDNTKPEYRDYMTEEIKTVLLSILDITYI